MDNQGWVKLHRKLKDTSFYKRSTVVHLFIHLLFSVNRETKKFYWNRQEVEVLPGQLITGLFSLSKDTGISIQSLRTALDVLKSTNTITIKPTNRFSWITVSKWEDYQGGVTSQLTSKLTNNQQTTNKQLTTNKNIKNQENINTMTSPEIKNVSSIGDILHKRTGISTAWQDKAFRYATSLKIDLKDQSLKGRWLKFFKLSLPAKIEKAYGYLIDYQPFTSLPTAEAKIKYFFWYYSNK